MPPKDQKQRTAQLQANNAKRGLKQVKVWVPEHLIPEVKAHCAQLREDFLKSSE